MIGNSSKKSKLNDLEIQTPIHKLGRRKTKPSSPKNGKFKQNPNHDPLGRFQKLVALAIFSCFFGLTFLVYNEKDMSGPIFHPRPRLQLQGENSDEFPINSNFRMLKDKEMTCHLPKLQPFDPAILKYVKKPNPLNCGKDHPLIFETDLNNTLIQLEEPSNHGYHNCCYQSFEKIVGNENKVKYDKNCTPILSQETVINSPTQFIRINCFNGNKTVPVDLFGFIPPKPNGSEYSNSDSTIKEQTENGLAVKKPNVLILGIDSVSHMNFQRVMPLTFKYLTQNLSGIGMNGYTKVGDNTFPNIVPVLMGNSSNEIQTFCWNKTRYFDDCPFIWKKFKEQGYLTAYGEDAVWMGIFKYVKKGFKSAPVDHYFNTLSNEMSGKIGHEKHGNAKWCYGPRLAFQILLDFVQKMAFHAQGQGQNQRYFQFIWETSLFHDSLNAGMLADKLVLGTLKFLQNGGYLNDTILILMSDHGIRYGSLRSTFQGRIEERMPFLYFVLPPWFSAQDEPNNQFQGALSNLKRNENRLTTPFDLHETLLDLLFIQNITNKRVRQRHREISSDSKKPRGISLFLPIPLDRNCESAEIPQNFCVCRSMKDIKIPIKNNNTNSSKNNSLSLVNVAAENVVQFLNQMFLTFPQCQNLTLSKINNAQVLQSSSEKIADTSDTIENSNDPRLSKQAVTFLVSLSTSPSDADFEGMVTRETNGTWTSYGEISRTNLYGNQSRCVDDYNMKKYCFCG